MAGAGQADNALINVPQGPLVTPAQPSGPDAVNAMIDAFRKGAITAGEIVDRFGLAARAKTQATTSAAELMQAQAEAQKPLVQPMAELQQAQTASGLATTNWGQTSLKTAQETMGWFGDDLSNYKLPNGQTDFQKLAKVGAQRSAQLSQVDAWANMLKPTGSREITLKSGEKKMQYVNARGEDVTPPSGGVDGSAAYWHYVDQMSKYLPSAHPLTKLYPMKYVAGLVPWDPQGQPVTASGPGATTPNVATHPEANPLALGPYVDQTQTGAGQNMILPESPKVSQMRAQLVNSGKDMQEVLKMTPEQVVAASPMQDVVKAAAGSPVVTPATPPVTAPPVIQPSLSQNYEGGISIAPAWTEPQLRAEETKMRDSLLKEPPVANWLASVPYQKTFEKNADRVRNLTPEQQKGVNLNMVDMGLAESLIKLYDPQGVIREFKWDKMTSHQPTLDMLKAGPEIYLKRNGTFTPETRKELIRMGDEIIGGREEAAAPFIAKTVSQSESIPGTKLGNILTSEDTRVAAEALARKVGTPAKSSTQAAALPRGIPEGALIGNITGFGRGYMSGNVFYPVKQ